jgi:hypothetical protein
LFFPPPRASPHIAVSSLVKMSEYIGSRISLISKSDIR